MMLQSRVCAVNRNLVLLFFWDLMEYISLD